MAADKSPLEATTGYIGIGAIELLGLLAAVDGRTGFYELVVAYMPTAVLFAVQCLALAYLLGLCTAMSWALVAEKRTPLSATLLAHLSDAKAEHLVARFCEAERQSRLLGGSTVSLIVLAVGILVESKTAAQFKGVALVAASLFVTLGVACGLLAHTVRHRAAAFILLALPRRDAYQVIQPDID